LNATLVKIARSPLIDSGDLKPALEFILEQVAHCLEVERVSVWRHNEDRNEIFCLNLFEKSKGRHSSGPKLNPADFPAYFDCLNAERVLSADDARTNPHTREFTDKYLIPLGITSMLDAPIHHSGELIGILCNEHVGAARHWTLKQQYFAGVVAEMISRAFAAEEKQKVKEDLVRVNSNLEKMNQRLAKINREKDDLLMMVSHELKTPLHVIGGWADLLVRGEVEDGQVRGAYEAISRNVTLQSHIIDDLLDTSRIILGRLVLNRVPCDVAAVLENSIASCRMLAQKKNQAIKTFIPAAPAHLWGDPGRVQQVFSNLLANAVKYSPAGGEIEVGLRIVQDSAEIQVRDSGEGIEETLLPMIFERFSQGDSSVTRAHGGLGLGLAIAKHLVEAHGGVISAASAGKGRGATFTVIFPLMKAYAGAGTRGPHDERTRQPLKNLKLLVVEDEPDSRTLAEVLLTEHGAIVETAGDASAGIQHLKKFKPDLLLCDLAMPGEDGFSLMQRIRLGAAPGFEKIPAIAVSAFTDVDSQSHAIGSGFQEFVPKPLNGPSFVNAILRVLRRPH
jgi:signal transduction histidine kinase/ActR/RegA family two-component response regulator